LHVHANVHTTTDAHRAAGYAYKPTANRRTNHRTADSDRSACNRNKPAANHSTVDGDR
jgi:hypothetical protein